MEEQQRQQVSDQLDGRTIDSFRWDDIGHYWVLTAAPEVGLDGFELCVRTMTELQEHPFVVTVFRAFFDIEDVNFPAYFATKEHAMAMIEEMPVDLCCNLYERKDPVDGHHSDELIYIRHPESSWDQPCRRPDSTRERSE